MHSSNYANEDILLYRRSNCTPTKLTRYPTSKTAKQNAIIVDHSKTSRVLLSPSRYRKLQTARANNTEAKFRADILF